MLVKQSHAVERMERKLGLAMGARPRDPQACIEALEEAIYLARTDAEAAEWFTTAELFGELADEYEGVGRTDDALEAMRRALELGWHGRPDGRCRLAEILMRAGRVEQATPIWAQVRRDTPNDVWLYNSAGMEYAARGDHNTALGWFTDGLELALDSGDPEQLVAPLAQFRGDSLAALGRQGDALQARALAFVEVRRSRASARTLGDAVRAAAVSSAAERAAWAWFPSGEYQQARRRWPGVTEAEAIGEVDHLAYCRRLQARLRNASGAGAQRIMIVPVVADGFAAWCDRRGVDPAHDPIGLRDAYAVALAAEHPRVDNYLATGAQRTVLVRRCPQVQAVLRDPERRPRLTTARRG